MCPVLLVQTVKRSTISAVPAILVKTAERALMALTVTVALVCQATLVKIVRRYNICAPRTIAPMVRPVTAELILTVVVVPLVLRAFTVPLPIIIVPQTRARMVVFATPESIHFRVPVYLALQDPRAPNS